MEKSGRWYGVYRADILQADGVFAREQCWQPLGLVHEQSEHAAWRQFQPYLDRVNDAARKFLSRAGLTLAEFVKEWRRDVAVNLRAARRERQNHISGHTSFRSWGVCIWRRSPQSPCKALSHILPRRTIPQDGRERVAHPFITSQNGEGLGLCERRLPLCRPDPSARGREGRAAKLHGR